MSTNGEFLDFKVSQVYSGDKSEFYNVMKQSYNLMMNLWELEFILSEDSETYNKKVREYKNSELMNMVPFKEFDEDEEEDFGEFQLDYIDDRFIVNSPEYVDIFNFSDFMNSSEDSLNNMLKSFFATYRNLINKLDDYVQEYTPLGRDEIKALKNKQKNALAYITSFIAYQFRLDDTLNSISESTRLEYTLYVFNYASDMTNDIYDGDISTRIEVMAKTVISLVASHRPNLAVFDDVPELEEKFYDVASRYIYDYEKLEDRMVVADVKRIVKLDSDLDEQEIKDIISNILTRSISIKAVDVF